MSAYTVCGYIKGFDETFVQHVHAGDRIMAKAIALDEVEHEVKNKHPHARHKPFRPVLVAVFDGHVVNIY